MKFSQLRDQFIADQTAAGTASDALASAQADYQVKMGNATKTTAAFATAIVSKGGEVADVSANPPVTYRSDGQSVKTVALVTMDSDVPDAPAPPPAPAASTEPLPPA